MQVAPSATRASGTRHNAACPAECNLTNLFAERLWQTAVYVGPGNAALIDCTFLNNFATEPALVHAASPRGPRLLLNETTWIENSYATVRLRASQFDWSARVFSWPRIDVLDAKSKQIRQSKEASFEASTNFLSPRDAWLRQQMNAPNISLTQPPFWSTGGFVTPGTTPTNVAVAISIFSALLGFCMIVGILGKIWRRKQLRKHDRIMQKIYIEQDAQVRGRLDFDVSFMSGGSCPTSQGACTSAAPALSCYA